MKYSAFIVSLLLAITLSRSSFAQAGWVGGDHLLVSVITNELLPDNDTEARSSSYSAGTLQCQVSANSYHPSGSATIQVKFKRIFTYQGTMNPPPTLQVSILGNFSAAITSSGATAQTKIIKDSGATISDSASWSNYPSYDYATGWSTYTPSSTTVVVTCYAKATGYQGGAATKASINPQGGGGGGGGG